MLEYFSFTQETHYYLTSNETILVNLSVLDGDVPVVQTCGVCVSQLANPMYVVT